MKAIILLLLLALFAVKDDKKKLFLNEALEKSMIKADVSGLGGYQGYCIELTATNTSSIDTTFFIEAGRRLDSEDSTVQDILLVKEIPLFVKAGETKTIPVYGFCCQATNSGPSKGEKYRIGDLKNEKLVAIAKFLNEYNYDLSTTQSAVWIVSNGHVLSSITAETPEKRKEIRPLQNFLAKLMGLSETFSWYTLSYKEDTTRLFSGNADSLFGDYEFELWNNCIVKLIINDDKNNVIRRLIVDKAYNPGKYSYELKMNVSEWPKGKYYVRLYSDNQRKVERVFEL